MYRLHFQDRTSRRAPFETREPYLTIGRGADCRLCLPENGVSAQHALIERRDDGYHIRDLASAIGVRVNGELVKDQRLATGDEVEVGSVRMRFEIVHERPPSHRRTIDGLQVTAAVAIVLLMAGQMALLGYIFSTERSMAARTDLKLAPGQQSQSTETPATAGAGSSSDSGGLLAPLDVSGTAPTTVPPASSILPHMIKVMRVDRTDGTQDITLRIQVKAQAAERDLNASAVAIGVEFVGSPEDKIVWVNIPLTWDNFTARTLVARYFGSPREVKGTIVRTYYHKQLQDVLATPPAAAR